MKIEHEVKYIEQENKLGKSLNEYDLKNLSKILKEV